MWISIILMGAPAAVFAWVGLGANAALANYGPVIASAYRLRNWLFGLAVIILIAAIYGTLRKLPYVNSTAINTSGVTVRPVEAVAEQWAWTITPNTFHVGQTAEFRVTSKGVNHGFALYDPQMHIVGQVQAMPGYTNVLRYTFTEPGVYRVLCLEYCGVAHQGMSDEIKVTPR